MGQIGGDGATGAGSGWRPPDGRRSALRCVWERARFVFFRWEPWQVLVELHPAAAADLSDAGHRVDPEG